MLENFLKIVKKKNTIDQKQEWYNGSITYFEGLKDEVEEVTVEMKENNKVHLEDELGDILWVYLNLLEGLKNEGKIDSMESVLKRAEKKFTERFDAIEENTSGLSKTSKWSEVKIKQKAELKKEHQEKYG